MGLFSLLALLAVGFACLGTCADATAGTAPLQDLSWAGTIGPVHAACAALVLIVTFKMVRGAHRH